MKYLYIRERTSHEAGENFIMRSFIIITQYKVLSGDQIKQKKTRIFSGKTEGKRLLRTPAHRCRYDVISKRTLKKHRGHDVNFIYVSAGNPVAVIYEDMGV
jgi:hypothetical protein